MFGQMMDQPLLISSILTHAANYHSDSEIVTRTVEGPIHRYTYKDAEKRSKKMAFALKNLGVQQGDRIGTLGWNTFRHFELYYSISGIGAICHTINPRLFHEQISYIVKHAADKFLFIDTTFIPIIEKLKDELDGVEQIILMTSKENMPDSKISFTCYEDLIDSSEEIESWPTFDEKTASSLCYTSGTTGNPKGVLYHHKSTIMHAYASCLPDTLNLSASDTVLPVVPMFHVNAWGLPYSCPLTGAKIVFPGSKMDGESLYELFESEKVTCSAGVPTIWMGLLNFMKEKNVKFSSLNRTIIGGSACPPAMIENFQNEFNVNVLHAWGMTELSPLGTVVAPKKKHLKMSKEEYLKVQTTQGRPVFGVDIQIIDSDNKPLPWDGKAFGDLVVKGPWIVSDYYNNPSEESFIKLGEDLWFRTGDVVSIDPDGYIKITDRSKDVIKSGGEWISSIELENTAMAHPKVKEAAVIAIKDVKWDERPLLIIVKKDNVELDESEILSFFKDKVAKWCIPDKVIFTEEIPHTATGKILKTKLRELYS